MTHPFSGSLVESTGALQLHGRALLTTLHSAAQALRLYPFDNATVQKALDELDAAARRALQQEGALELRMAGDFLFLNDARLRLDLTNYVSFSFVSGALSRHGLGSFGLEPEIRREEWGPFLALLTRDPPAPDFDVFLEWLAASPVRNIHVGQKRDIGDSIDGTEGREIAKRAYVQSVQVAREVLTDTRLGKAVNVRRIKHAVQGIVDQVLNNESSILGMTTLRDYDEYTFTHSVNVCIFSVIIGQKLGLTKLQLYELGLGALFHDLGKMRIDPEVTNKPSALTPAEAELMREHPAEGLLALFAMHGFGEVPYRAMLIAYEHHMKIDLTGFPKHRRPRNPTLFPRIVAVADAFDAATSKRSYQPLPWRPEQALKEMRDNPARGYDRLVVKAFINVTGIFPIGTMVILDSYELAVVISPNADRERVHQPVVRLLTDPFGQAIPGAPIVDLGEEDPATGKPRRAIIKTTDPDRYGIRVADYVT
jgi:HD-GYP domain-containing protein (c-di-GMP phosphodiesterase class II)